MLKTASKVSLHFTLETYQKYPVEILPFGDTYIRIFKGGSIMNISDWNWYSRMNQLEITSRAMAIPKFQLLFATRSDALDITR